MSRLVVSLVVVLVILFGALFLLAGHASQRPATHVEKAVDLANLA